MPCKVHVDEKPRDRTYLAGRRTSEEWGAAHLRAQSAGGHPIQTNEEDEGKGAPIGPHIEADGGNPASFIGALLRRLRRPAALCCLPAFGVCSLPGLRAFFGKMVSILFQCFRQITVQSRYCSVLSLSGKSRSKSLSSFAAFGERA